MRIEEMPKRNNLANHMEFGPNLEGPPGRSSKELWNKIKSNIPNNILHQRKDKKGTCERGPDEHNQISLRDNIMRIRSSTVNNKTRQEWTPPTPIINCTKNGTLRLLRT